MQIGIVGKPSSGKSTFFSSSTLVDVAMASYPFTTIEPNKGTGFVRVDDAGNFFNVISDPKHGFLVEKESGNIRYIPVELIDVAGLVPGANEGKGLGNKFLNDLSGADALVHVVDASGLTDEEGKATTGHDPCKDVEFLEKEIELWFLKIIENNWSKFGKSHEKEYRKKVELLSQNLSGVKILTSHIESALKKLALGEKSFLEWDEEDKMNFATQCRKYSKPIIIAANKCDLPNAESNIKKMREKFPDKTIVACSAASELALRKAAKQDILEYYPGEKDFTLKGELNDKQKEGLETVRKNVMEKFGGTGIQTCLDETILGVLDYIPIFPGGTKTLKDKNGNTLVDCFLMKTGSTAIDFAYTLHTDMGDGFIRAIDVKTKQIIGKDHVLKSGDVIELMFKKP
ncbi:MAG: redox-regulated ATPase YchF [Candidatus Diapherotrites archaeon]|jgi:ribosome-binding ATPase|uniref:Redox-regulated ATPase YchF n=1 Tax=Candidatus Iainarchaeum sp. TaxID=3101447 RepID=A0A8T5GGX7_9ARCH|nr:redox-regulated ATPase YchF [Candidatus Diapherotrites archaeon]MBT7241754.1 redox-regulated ATPase YchF [Candidatus Diapherotrites archaeon]